MEKKKINLQKVREEGEYKKVKKNLASKSAFDKEQKDIIWSWVEAGLKDASTIIGKNLSREIDKQLKQEVRNSPQP